MLFLYGLGELIGQRMWTATAIDEHVKSPSPFPNALYRSWGHLHWSYTTLQANMHAPFGADPYMLRKWMYLWSRPARDTRWSQDACVQHHWPIVHGLSGIVPPAGRREMSPEERKSGQPSTFYNHSMVTRSYQNIDWNRDKALWEMWHRQTKQMERYSQAEMIWTTENGKP